MAEKTVTFELRVDEKELERGLRAALHSAGRLDDGMNRVGSISSSSFAKFSAGASDAENATQALNRSLQNMIARVASVTALAAFGREVVKVRSEFQALEITIGSLLQDAEKAKEITASLVEIAVRTPLELLDLSQGAKQLIAYGVATEEITDMLVRLGNIATGLNLPLERLTYLYGTTMTQGRLLARNMIQFTTSGVPLLQTLADMFGKTTEQINKMVTAGQIGAEEVKAAVMAMTNEGGKFYGINEKLSDATMVAISNLKDQLQIAMNEIGEANQSLINDSIAAAAYLLEHYKDILDVLVPLIAAYGAYKAAIIATAAAQKVIASAESISAFFALTKQIHSAKDAMLLLNMATNASTIGLIAGAIGGLVAITTRLSNKAKEAAQAKEDLLAPMRKEVTLVNSLVTKISDSNTKESERLELLKQLRQINPEIVANIKNEADAQEFLTERLEKYNKVKMAEIALKAYSIDAKFDKYVKELTDARDVFESEQSKVINTYTTLFSRYQQLIQSNANVPDELKTLFDSLINSAIPESEKLEMLFAAYRSIEQKVKEAAGAYTGSDWSFVSRLFQGLNIDKYEKAVDKLDKATGRYNTKATQFKERIAQTATALFGASEAADEFVSALMQLYFPSTETPPPAEKIVINIQEAVVKAKENIQKLEAELKRLRATEAWEGDEKSFLDAIASKEAELKAARDLYEALTGIDIEKLVKKESEELKKINKEYNDYIRDSAEKANWELVKLQLQQEKERVDAMEEGTKKRKALFELEQKDRLATAQKYIRDVVNEQLKLEKNKGTTAGYGELAVGFDGKLAYRLAEKGLTPTSEQLTAIEEMVKQWNQRIEDMWVEEMKLDPLYGDHLAADLLAYIDAELMTKLATGRGFDALKDQASIIFADITSLSASMIQKIISNAEKYVAVNKKLTSEEIAEYRKAIDRANELLVQKNPWEALKIAQDRYLKALGEYNAAINTGDIDAQNRALVEQATALSIIRQSYEELGEILKEVTGIFGEIAVAMGVDESIAKAVENMANKFADLLVASGLLSKALLKVAETTGEAGKSFSDAAKEIGDGKSALGMIGAMISAYSAITQVIQAVESAKEAAASAAAEAYLDKINAQLDRLKKKLEGIESLSRDSGGWFGRNAIREITDLYNAFDYQEKMLDRLVKGVIAKYKTTFDTYASLFARFNNLSKKERKQLGDLSFGAEIYKAVAKLQDALKEAGMRIGEFRMLDIASVREQIRALEDLHAFLSKGGDDLAELAGDALLLKQSLELYIEYFDKLKTSVESLVGDISGNILSSVNSMWKEIREGGEATLDDLTKAAKKNIAEIVDSIVSQQLWSTYMSKYFDKLGEELTAAIIEGGDTKSILSVFDSFWSSMEVGLKEYTDAYEMFLKSAEARGWDMSGTSFSLEVKPAKDSIKAMREELAKLQAQWASLTAEEREGTVGERLFGDIKDLEAKITAAENLYDITKDIDGSINDINNKLSELNAAWDALSPEDREGIIGEGIKADIEYYKQLLEAATAMGRTELESLQALINSAEIKYNLYQKWIELYGEEQAEQMMGAVLVDAQKYLEQLRSGIAALQAKVTDGLISDEEISQLAAWEQQLADILNAALQASKDASRQAYDTWAESLNLVLSSVDTDYDRLIAYQDAYNQLLISTRMSAEDLAEALVETERNIANLQDQIYKNLYSQYKTQDMEHHDTLEQYKRDIEYLEENGYLELAESAREKLSEYVSDIAIAGLEATDEYNAIFLKLTEISIEEAQRALDAYRIMVSSSDELTKESKDKIIASLDDIQEKINSINADNILQQFNDIQDVINSIANILSDLGAGDNLVKSISGVSTLISGISQVVLAGGNPVAIIMGIAKVVKGFVSIGRNMSEWLKGEDNSTKLLDELSRAYERLGEAAVYAAGAQRRALYDQQQENISARLAELQGLINFESSKKRRWWDVLGLFSEDADKELIEKWSNEYDNLLELQKKLASTREYDFLLTDFESFSNTIAEIVRSNIASIEDIFNAIDKNSEEFIQRLITNFLRIEMLEEPIKNLLQNLFAESGGESLNYEALQDFKNKISEYSGNFYDALKLAYEAMGYDLTLVNDNQLKQGVASASEETVSAVAGIVNAMSMRQAEGIVDIRRQTEIAVDSLEIQVDINKSVIEVAKDVAEIRRHTGFIEKIYRIINNNAGDLFNMGVQL